MLEFRILGPLGVNGERGPIRLGGTKQRSTLAILLLNANRVVSIDQLADELYAGAAPISAVKQVHRQVSELRKILGPPSPIDTVSPGYVLRIGRDQLDLYAFERLTADASEAFADGDARLATDLVRRALGLWRGAPLADLTYESFARAPIERLGEMLLAAVEQRVDAELALGRHTELVAELEELVSEHPLRERFLAQLMLALYRSGRQAEALGAYRKARARLSGELGIAPTPGLQRLERQILTHDQSLQFPAVGMSLPAPSLESKRSVLVISAGADTFDALLAFAEPLAKLPGRELIIVRLVASEGDLADAFSALNERRQAIEADVRIAAFTTDEPALDVVRLATTYDVDLVLMNAPPKGGAPEVPAEVAAVLERSPADVALVSGIGVDWTRGDGVFVPFGGAEHDWAALELGAWLVSGVGAPLRLVGTRADPRRGQRDASRLLANASLAVQRVLGVTSEPVLAESTEDALIEAVQAATLVVVGVSPRWRREGIGAVRRALAHGAHPPVVLVHGGPRPGGLAPRETRTRFSWSIEV